MPSSDFDLLDAVQPPNGWYAIVGIKDGFTTQKLVQTRDEVEELISKFTAQQRNVYFGVAKYKSKANRKKENVEALKAFWMDIDCGEDKALAGKGYKDHTQALQALIEFTQAAHLPKPTVVNSGYGLHVYWPLVEPVSRETWEPVAARLKELCKEHGFLADPSAFEAARILRIPGSYNYKNGAPKPVELIRAGVPVEFETFATQLHASLPRTTRTNATLHNGKRELSPLAQSLRDKQEGKFQNAVRECNQLCLAVQENAHLGYERWRDALSVAQRCTDREKAIRMVSKDHPDYDFQKACAKAEDTLGPHYCSTFEQNNPSGCKDCRHKGTISSPIQLARINPQEEIIDEITGAGLPKLTYPYSWGNNGEVVKAPPADSEEAEAITIYERSLYVVKRMHDVNEGDVVLMRLHTKYDGVKDFIIPNYKIPDPIELRKVLAIHGVITWKRKSDLILEYVIHSVKELQAKERAEQMRPQFGWADHNSKFIVGDREITAEGTFHSPPSAATAKLASFMEPVGSLERWKEVFALYSKPGLEPNAFAALTAFGAPLFKFLGQKGAIINLIHPDSGTGKTTTLHMCASVWGSPDRLCATQEDTLNAKVMKLGLYNNLPFCIDEMTNMSPQDFSVLTYCITQGYGKDRVKASANELRLNLTSWQTMALCSSNSSFYEKMTTLKNSPQGEMMRLLEYKIDYSNALEKAHAKHMFDHVLMENYGHAGDIYAKYLVTHLEEVKELLARIQAKIDREMKLTQRERFWSAVITANLIGGRLAKHLDLIDWDMPRLYEWATGMVQDLRYEVAPPTFNVVEVIGGYLNSHIQNMLVIDDAVDCRSGLPAMPLLAPKGELLARYEPDSKRLYLAAAPFKRYCIGMQVNFKETIKTLERKGIYTGTAIKRLSKGMAAVSPPVYCLTFDGNNPEFFDVSGFVTPSAEDAGTEH